MLEETEALAEAAKEDADALTQLDRRLLDLKAAIDTVEDAIEWPKLLEKAEEARSEMRKIVDQYGEVSDRNTCRTLENEHPRAISSGDPAILQQHIGRMWGLYFQVITRQEGWWVGRFQYLLEEQKPMMQDQNQADRLFAQGNRAINNNDVEALKEAVRQLNSLLPPSKRDNQLNNDYLSDTQKMR